jgi:hypothetical protein
MFCPHLLGDDSLVKGQAGLGTVPADELVDGMPVGGELLKWAKSGASIWVLL